jgi:hypothetical protein
VSWFFGAFLEKIVISSLLKQGYRTNLPILGSSFAGLPADPGCLIGGLAIQTPFQSCDARLQLP